MKALSIKEPWATLILEGKKTIETRTWRTNFEGDILLCASKKPVSNISGHAFAIATLIGCFPMRTHHIAEACCDVYPGAYAWLLRDVEPIKPFPVKGSLGLFNVDYKPCPFHGGLNK